MNSSNQQTFVLLVSFARGEPYEHNMLQMKAAITNLGFASSMLWYDADVRKDPIYIEKQAQFSYLDDCAFLANTVGHNCRP